MLRRITYLISAVLVLLFCSTPYAAMDIYYVHTDHLGAPRVITDKNQNVAWKATYKPFGEVQIQSSGLELNIRFPGQYYDAESGLHYNYYRDYDPTTGRYIQSDPIGLNGGLNTYGYSYQNPISNIDPDGRFAFLFALPIVAEAALSAWDAYDLYDTLTDDCASDTDKWIAGTLFAAGLFLPGNAGWVDNVAKSGERGG